MSLTLLFNQEAGITSQVFSDSISITDLSVIDKNLILTDSTALSDSVLVDKILSLSDSINLSDAITLTKILAFTDSIGLADAKYIDKILPLTDTVLLSDTELINKILKLTDLISLTDLFDVLGQLKQFLDSVALSDSISTPSRTIIHSDTISLDDLKLIHKTLELSDSVSLGDLFFAITAAKFLLITLSQQPAYRMILSKEKPLSITITQEGGS